MNIMFLVYVAAGALAFLVLIIAISFRVVVPTNAVIKTGNGE